MVLELTDAERAKLSEELGPWLFASDTFKGILIAWLKPIIRREAKEAIAEQRENAEAAKEELE